MSSFGGKHGFEVFEGEYVKQTDGQISTERWRWYHDVGLNAGFFSRLEGASAAVQPLRVWMGQIDTSPPW